MNVAFTPAVLSDGSQIGVEVRSSNAGPGVVAVQLRRGEIVVDEVLLPYPSAGLGGGRIILSSSEQFALLSLFSGQSEEAYELFSVGHRLTSLASLSYQLGEAASYCFSPDDSLLVMALPFTCSEWWLPWDEGEVEPEFASVLANSVCTRRRPEGSLFMNSWSAPRKVGSPRELTTTPICGPGSWKTAESRCRCHGARLQ